MMGITDAMKSYQKTVDDIVMHNPKHSNNPAMRPEAGALILAVAAIFVVAVAAVTMMG